MRAVNIGRNDQGPASGSRSQQGLGDSQTLKQSDTGSAYVQHAASITRQELRM